MSHRKKSHFLNINGHSHSVIERMFFLSCSLFQSQVSHPRWPLSKKIHCKDFFHIILQENFHLALDRRLLDMSALAPVFTSEACARKYNRCWERTESILMKCLAIDPYSQAFKSSSFLFISGQIPINMDGNSIEGTITEKTLRCIENIKEILAG